VAGRVFLAQAAHRAYRNEVAHAELLKAVDIGPIGHLARREAMADAVARQERNALARNCPDNIAIAGCAKRRLKRHVLNIFKAVDGVQATPADHTNRTI